MGDVQQYFIDKKVRNFYSVSISGYHPSTLLRAGAAEAGANPISLPASEPGSRSPWPTASPETVPVIEPGWSTTWAGAWTSTPSRPT